MNRWLSDPIKELHNLGWNVIDVAMQSGSLRTPFLTPVHGCTLGIPRQLRHALSG